MIDYVINKFKKKLEKKSFYVTEKDREDFNKIISYYNHTVQSNMDNNKLLYKFFILEFIRVTAKHELTSQDALFKIKRQVFSADLSLLVKYLHKQIHSNKWCSLMRYLEIPTNYETVFKERTEEELKKIEKHKEQIIEALKDSKTEKQVFSFVTNTMSQMIIDDNEI